MEPDTGQVTRYLHDPQDPTSLGGNSLTFLHVDRSGVLWVGTASAGLDRLDPDGDTFTHYREGDGLASDRIVSILEDGDADDPAAGNLWIATGKGLSKLDRDRKTFRSFGVSDGLPLTEFHRDSHKTRSGELLIGSTDGLIAFDPADLTDDVYIPPIVFTDFLLANEPVKISANSPLQQAIDLTDVIELTHADQVISIEFAALSYSTPSQNRYRYRLEGFEEDWIEVDSTRRLVTYTNLDPGRYVFRVTGSNGDGVWNEVGREIALIIPPPWWQTMWFRGGVLLLLVGLVAGVIVTQRQSSRRRERHLEVTVAERTHELDEMVEELRVSEEKYRDLVEKVSDVIYTIDAGGVITYLNPAIESIIGLRPEQVVGQPIAQFVHADDLGQLQDNLQNLSSGVAPGPTDYRVLTASGETRWIRVTSQPIVDGDGVIGLQGVLTDITERKKVELQLEQAAATAERDRLARRLHDAVTQTLFSASVIAESTPRIMDNDPELGKRNLEQLAIMLRGSLAEMRTMLIELRPQELVGKSLDELMRTLVDGNQVRIGCPVNLVIDGEGSLPEEVTVVLYRIAQEAINNIIKYAEADEVGVNIAYNDGGIEMIVNDNGRGFEPAKISSGKFGLKIMAERMDQIEGELTIASKPGHGTQVKANWSEGANHE